MSDWASLLIVVWALYATHGIAWRRAPRFHFTAWWGRARAAPRFATWSLFGPSPLGWRLRTDDVPVSLSAEGISNLPVGSLARPSPLPTHPIAWRWDEIKTAELRGSTLWINGHPFAPATGHVSAPEILRLVAADPPAREARIRFLLRRGLRPWRLRRLHHLLVKRTAAAAACNLTAAVIFGVASLYLGLGVPAMLDERTSGVVARSAPWLLAYAGGLQIAAIVFAWRAARQLARHGGGAPGSLLGSAIFLPPQTFHLRALLAEGLWPRTHPLAAALAFGSPKTASGQAFNVLADLRWPLPLAAQGESLPQRIARSHRVSMLPLVEQVLRSVGLDPVALLAAPFPDDSTCCAYCPRCRDQFVTQTGQCPHGIPLQPMP